MKGYREEIPKEEFHRIPATPSGSGRFIRNTAWPNSPSYSHVPLPGLDARHGTRRQRPFDPLPAKHADLASWWSCAFIQTQDVGRVGADGAFVIEGRIDHSDIRGCNLLVQ